MDINYVHNKDDSEKDKNLYYLTKAYYNAFESLSEEIILLKNGVQIPPDRIMDIRPLHCYHKWCILYKITPFPERPTLEEPMRKLIFLLVMILLLLSAALAEVSTPTCTTVTLATGSVHGGFHREDA